MITKISHLAMVRQSGFKYGFQRLVETVQHSCMGENPAKTIAVVMVLAGVLHQRLHTCELVQGFSGRVSHL